MFEGISRWWCRRTHSKAMWPIHGRYICRVCLREYPVSWLLNEEADAAVESRQRMASNLGEFSAELQNSTRS